MARSQDDPAALPCPNCGYDLRVNLLADQEQQVTCPECGAAHDLRSLWQKQNEPRLDTIWWCALVVFSPGFWAPLSTLPLAACFGDAKWAQLLFFWAFGVMVVFSPIVFLWLGWKATGKRQSVGNRILTSVFIALGLAAANFLVGIGLLFLLFPLVDLLHPLV